VLSKLYSPISELMELVRTWALLLERYRIDARVQYINTRDNFAADAISRGEVEVFLAAFPQASSPTWPAGIRYYDEIV